MPYLTLIPGTRPIVQPHLQPPAVAAFLERLTAIGAEILAMQRAGARIEVSWRMPGADPAGDPIVTEFLSAPVFGLATLPIEDPELEEEGPDDEIAVLPDALALAASAERAAMRASGIAILSDRRL